MKLETKSISLNLSKVLVQRVKEAYGEKNTSKAINSALIDALFLPDAYSEKATSNPMHQLLDKDERSNPKLTHIRIPAALRQILDDLIPCTNLQDTMSMLLAQILYTPLNTADFSAHTHLLNVLGSKWNTQMQGAIKNIADTCGKRWELSVECCAGALGIHSNVSFADTRIINDDDWNKINLYMVLKDYHRELFLLMRTYDVSLETFNQLKQMQCVPSKKIDIKAAARYLFCNLTSFRHEGSTFLNTMTKQAYRKLLLAIYPTHKCLADTEILEQDLFAVIEKYRKKPDTLFIVDPPYLGTNVYKSRLVSKENTHGKNFDLKEHKRLANQLRLVKEKNNNDFIYFCRITVTRKKNKRNQIISTDEELRLGDKDLLGTIDDLYYCHGFFYTDVELGNGIIERIITSFNFHNAIPYG